MNFFHLTAIVLISSIILTFQNCGQLDDNTDETYSSFENQADGQICTMQYALMKNAEGQCQEANDGCEITELKKLGYQKVENCDQPFQSETEN